ncbi:MAG TPA: hypothetical protein VFS10_10095, partial [Pyrinomonadaceae bacterium]|nr:hypothetical protein [Pyrinomonadaceae bacterium]
RDGTFTCPTLKAHPQLGLAGKDDDKNGVDDWLGAQTTIQRWYADPVRDNQGNDRTLNTVFTHDHYGPSTHQQAGFYAGLIVERPNTQWFHSETGAVLGNRVSDGGPTTWQAKIHFPSTPTESFREFLLEFADFQLAYEKGGGINAAGLAVADPANVINPPAKDETGLPFLVEKAAVCPGTTFAPPCPEAISAADVGTMSVNYRNEPLALRVFNPSTQAQTSGAPGDLSHAYRSLTNRAISELNYQPIPQLTNGLRPGDPATPLMRVFENDKVRIRVLVGAHEEGHNLSIHGLRWLFQPADPNSGFRNNQMMAISEWYDFVMPPLPVETGKFTDFLYTPGAGTDDQWNGLWGIIRAYRGKEATYPKWTENTIEETVNGTIVEPGLVQSDEEVARVDTDSTSEGPLETLSSNPEGKTADVEAFNLDASATDTDPTKTFDGAVGATPSATEPPTVDSNEAPAVEAEPTATTETTETIDGSRIISPLWPPVGKGVPACPQDAVRRPISVTAVSAQKALPQGTLFYNKRSGFGGQLHDPTAILYVRTNDLDAYNRLKPGVPVEPLVIRARAGECIQLTLRNRLPEKMPDLPGFNTLPMLVERFNANQVRPSKYVGLHPQLLRYDVRLDNGVNVGLNPDRVVAPGNQITYTWYAGDIVNKSGYIVGRPIEFGATSLSSSDPIKHASKGAIGALVIEPPNATWTLDSTSRASATVTSGGTSFREFVLLFQNDLNLRMSRDVAADNDDDEKGGVDNIASDSLAFDPEASASVSGTTYGNGGTDAAFVNVSRGKNTGFPVPNLAEAEDAEDSGQKAFNYRTEPLWNRMGFAPNALLNDTNDKDFTNSLSNSLVGGDPLTPVFRALPGQAARYRVVMPGGHARNETFMIHGHIWEEEPYTANSTVIGSRAVAEWKGVQFGIGAQSHFDFLPKNGAGGKFRVPGDYLFRTFHSFSFDGGMWGLFRVKNEPLPKQVIDNQ